MRSGSPKGCGSFHRKQRLQRPTSLNPASEIVGENLETSNEKNGPENENPGALAGATGINLESFFCEIDHNLKREAAARVLARAVAECDPADRLPFLETLIEGLCQGGPLPAFGAVMSAARDWASWATRAELKAYAVATFDAMGQPDQDAFLCYLDRRAVA